MQAIIDKLQKRFYELPQGLADELITERRREAEQENQTQQETVLTADKAWLEEPHPQLDVKLIR